MDKLTMAHEWYMKNAYQTTHEKAVIRAWQYADAMQAEADKRVKAQEKVDAEQIKRVRETLQNSGKEWQPDWSQAPENTTHWGVELSSAYWLKEEGNGLFCKIGKAPSFGYTGNWNESLRKRPE